MANNSETFTVQNNLVGNNNFAMISDSPEQRGESGERAVTPTEDSPPPYLAVLVKDAVKSYSSGEAVIKNMNMNVPIGSMCVNFIERKIHECVKLRSVFF